MFRSDLFYRLNVLPLHVPALRERQSDIPQILAFFLTHYSRKIGKRIDTISPETMERLVKYSWPGNIRELRNVIERGVVLSPISALTLAPDLLPPEIFQIDSVPGSIPVRSRSMDTVLQVPGHEGPPADTPSLEEVERRHILNVLEQSGWKINGPRALRRSSRFIPIPSGAASANWEFPGQLTEPRKRSRSVVLCSRNRVRRPTFNTPEDSYILNMFSGVDQSTTPSDGLVRDLHQEKRV